MTDQHPEPAVGREKIILKELDHIQAIMARFDTFSFLMKQVCLVGIGGLVSISASNKLKTFPFYICIVPVMFLVLEVSFRYFYWTRYVDRVETIRKYLQCKCKSPTIELYEIVKPPKSYCYKARWARWWKAFKLFDILYYSIWAILPLIAGWVLRADQW